MGAKNAIMPNKMRTGKNTELVVETLKKTSSPMVFS